MLLVRVPLLGSGEVDDPYRFNLPNGRLWEHDTKDKWAVVEVPPDDVPPEVLSDDQQQTVKRPYGLVITNLSRPAHRAWHAHLDRRFLEHKGKFRPQVV